MKKILLMFAIIIASLSAYARDTYSRDASVLPAKAQTFIKSNFKKGINHIKIDSKTFGGKEYDVILNDGTEIDFDNDGAWKSIDCGNASVPASIVPKAISNYVKKNYKGKRIVEIEIDRNKYEIQLSNGMELEFDRAGNFLKVD